MTFLSLWQSAGKGFEQSTKYLFNCYYINKIHRKGSNWIRTVLLYSINFFTLRHCSLETTHPSILMQVEKNNCSSDKLVAVMRYKLLPIFLFTIITYSN